MSQAGTDTRFESCTELRRRREQAGLSRVQVARRLRWATELVARFERGSAMPSLVEAAALAKLFEECSRLRARRRRHGSDQHDAPFIATPQIVTGNETHR